MSEPTGQNEGARREVETEGQRLPAAEEAAGDERDAGGHAHRMHSSDEPSEVEAPDVEGHRSRQA